MEEKKAGEKFPEYDKSDTVLSPKEQLLWLRKDLQILKSR